MNRQYITPEPIIASIDSEPKISNSSYGDWVVFYSIKWNLTDKNPIGTMKYFWRKKEAEEWIKEAKI